MRKILEQRLVKFSVGILRIVNKTENSFSGTYLSNQLIRSACSAALNYGEAQGAESKKNFVHKISIVLKELRESHITMTIIQESGMVNEPKILNEPICECNQLISIFYKTVKSCKENNK